MELVEINPFVRYLLRKHIIFSLNDDSICYDCRIFYVVSGTGNVCVENEIIELNKHSVLFFPPNTRYKFYQKNDSPLELIVINFDLTAEHCDKKKSLGTASENDFNPEKVLKCRTPREFQDVIICHNVSGIFEKLSKAENEYKAKNLYCSSLVSAYIKIALMELLSVASPTHKSSKLISEVKSYIMQHATEEMLNNDLAEHFHYHPHYLNKLMKRETGITLRQYIIQAKIDKAKELLCSTDSSIEDISWKSGFSSTSYFIKTFHNVTKETPRQYRLKRSSVHF